MTTVPEQFAALEERILDLEAAMTLYEAHVENLIERVADLETRKRKGGRKGKEIVVSAEGVCGLHPDRDSSTCLDAGIYRRQQGCMGIACVKASSEYYANYRKNNS